MTGGYFSTVGFKPDYTLVYKNPLAWGPDGVGKTTMCLAAAKEAGTDTVQAK